MSPAPITILFFSDSHLGFDLPVHPRIQMRRRGHDFFANYQHILDTAVATRVDLIIHGGDIFFRSRVPPSIVEKAYQPLAAIAEAGIPIYLVPGNHERSKLPAHLWLSHRNIHVFDQPKTFHQRVGDRSIALSGFPFARKIRQNFQSLLQQSGCLENHTGIRFLCMHQTVQGAKVGPADFTFRGDADTIPASQIPHGLTAVLCGHIHRNQILTHSLDKQPLPAPVIYSGSIERTSIAERLEEKHYVIIRINPEPEHPNPIIEFQHLPTRPMVRIEIQTRNEGVEVIKRSIRESISSLDPDSIVRIKLSGSNTEEIQRSISAAELRTLAPASMNISLAYQWEHRVSRSHPFR